MSAIGLGPTESTREELLAALERAAPLVKEFRHAGSALDPVELAATFASPGDPSSRATIVFLHGTRLTGAEWAVQVADFSDEFACLAPDLPGHGSAEDVPFTVDGAEAVRRAHELRPDVVLMDLLMPVMDGIAATAEIKQRFPDVEVVALTSFIEEDKVLAALESGASGFILKDADADDVAAAIRAAHNDEVHLDPAAARILAKGMRHRVEQEPAESLTERELEVLSLVGHGRSNKEIATDLGITERTARTHVSNILGKLDLQSRTQAALYAVERKLVHD